MSKKTELFLEWICVLIHITAAEYFKITENEAK